MKILATVSALISLGLLLASCGSTEVATVPPVPPPEETYSEFISLDEVLIDIIGVKLAMTPDQVILGIKGDCAPRSHFGGDPAQGVAVLTCTINDGGILWAGFSKPETGHKAWRLYYKIKGQNSRDAQLVTDIIEAIGPPRKILAPFEMWWRNDPRNFRIIGESDGLRLQLWDIRLNI